MKQFFILYRWWFVGGGLLVCLGIVGLLLKDTVRAQFQASHSLAPVAQVSPLPLPSPSSSELHDQLELEVVALRGRVQQLEATLSEVNTSVSSAIAEIAKGNDAYLKSLDEWKKSLGEVKVPTLTSASSPSKSSAGTKININTATQAELEELSGVGPSLAGKILAYRLEHGKFTSIDELDQVSGIGSALLEKMRPEVTI